jgi:hypothetical protein
MSISLTQHSRPSGAVKDIEVGMRENKAVPTRIAKRINDSYLNGWGGRSAVDAKSTCVSVLGGVGALCVPISHSIQ